MDKKKGKRSPYYETSDPVALYKIAFRHQLELLRIPYQRRRSHKEGACSRECHIIERNHAIDVIEHLIGVDKSIEF